MEERGENAGIEYGIWIHHVTRFFVFQGIWESDTWGRSQKTEVTY